jgi:entericidin B
MHKPNGVHYECRNIVIDYCDSDVDRCYSQLALQPFLGIRSQRYLGCSVTGVVDIVVNGAHLGYIRSKRILLTINREGKIMSKKLLTSLFLISLVSIFTGCNTIEGAGEDLEGGGEAIQRESREARD